MTLVDFRNAHEGDKCLIIADGPSAAEFPYNKIDFHTIAVNNAARYYIPDYQIFSDWLEYPSIEGPLSRRRADAMLNRRYNTVFTQHPSPYYADNIVMYQSMPITVDGITRLFDKGYLPAIVTTTEIAISLALYMGFETVGLIGYDMHSHGNRPQVGRINDKLSWFRPYCINNDIEIYNLSSDSLITAFPKISEKEFIRI